MDFDLDSKKGNELWSNWQGTPKQFKGNPSKEKWMPINEADTYTIDDTTYTEIT